MTSTKTVFAVVLAVALFAGAASAQTSPNEEAGDRTAVLEELVESQERLIGQQQALIDEQEALLNAYRCMFKVDVEVVPGGCPSPALSEEEATDGALLCAGWLEEREQTAFIVTKFVAIASTLERGMDTRDAPRFQPGMGDLVAGYHARVSAVIPNLKSERLTGLFSAMADALQTVLDANARGSSAEEMAAAIFAAVDRLNELDAVLAEICR